MAQDKRHFGVFFLFISIVTSLDVFSFVWYNHIQFKTMVITMSYNFDEASGTYVIADNLNENELYDVLLSIAKDNDLIEANHASESSHIMSILRNNSVEVEFDTV